MNKINILSRPMRLDHTEAMMKSLGVNIANPNIAKHFRFIKRMKTQTQDQHRALQSSFPRFVGIQYPAAPGEAVLRYVIEPHQTATLANPNIAKHFRFIKRMKT